MLFECNKPDVEGKDPNQGVTRVQLLTSIYAQSLNFNTVKCGGKLHFGHSTEPSHNSHLKVLSPCNKVYGGFTDWYSCL